MKRLFKVTAIILGCILLLFVLMVGCTGMALLNGIEQAAQEGVQPEAVQSVVVTPSGAVITTSLIPVKQLVLEGLEPCDFAQVDMTLNLPLPEDWTTHRMYQGKCVEQTVADLQQYVVTNYKGTVILEPAVMQQLQTYADGIGETGNSQFVGGGLVDYNGTVKVTLKYHGLVPTRDEFVLGTKVITVRYTPVPTQ